MKSSKPVNIFEICLIVIVLGMHLYAALSDAYNMPSAWFTRDDAYYYFKVAQNITEGKGSSFDGINPTNGYHPLWMVVCIPVFFLARYDLILPLRVLIMVMACFNLATAIMIYRYLKNNLSDPVAMLASMFWLFNAYIHYVIYEYGLESPIAAFSIVLFIYKLSQFEKKWRIQPVSVREVGWLAGIAVLMMFSRLDLIFLALIGGLWIILRGKAIRFFLPMDILIIFLSMVCSVALRTGIQSYNREYTVAAILMTMTALVIKTISLYLFGAYQHPRANSGIKTMQRTGLALVTGSTLTSCFCFLFQKAGLIDSFPRSAFIVDLIISLILIGALRASAYRFGGVQSIEEANPTQTLLVNWKKWATEGTVYYGILGGALAIYMLINKLMFDTTNPVSGQIKRWWGTLGSTVYERPPSTWTGFLGIEYRGPYDTWQPTSNFFHWLAPYARPIYPGADTLDERYYIIMAFSALIVLLIFFINAQTLKNKITNMALLPLMAGSGIHILSYTTTAYGGAKEWYWISQMLLVVLVESILLQLLLKPFQKFRLSQFVLKAAAITIGVILASRQAGYFSNVMLYNYYPDNIPYLDVLPYLEENTPPKAVIGMTGGGTVGYFIQDRTIVNMDGLINSYDYFQALKKGEAPAYLRNHETQIIFANFDLLEPPPYRGQFSSYLLPYSVYGGKSLMYLLDKPIP